MRKRWLALGATILLGGGLAAWFEPTCSVRGWARGEPFHDGRSATWWESMLQSPDPIDQAQIPERLTTADALPVVESLLGSRRESVRIHALLVLGKMGPAAKPTIPALLRSLDDADRHVRSAAAQSVASVGQDDARVCSALMARLDTEDRDLVIRPLSRFKGQARDAVPMLVKIMNGKHPSVVRWNAARTLGKIGPDAAAAIPDLIAALTDADDHVREHSAEALGDIGPLSTAAVPNLTAMLTDPITLIRRDAVRSLGNIGEASRPAIPEIEKLLKDREEVVRDAAKAALRRIDPQRRP